MQHTASVVRWLRSYAICADSNVGRLNTGPTSVLSSRRWANVSPTYIAVWLIRLWIGLPDTGNAHNRGSTPPSRWFVCSSVMCCWVVCSSVRLCRESTVILKLSRLTDTCFGSFQICVTNIWITRSWVYAAGRCLWPAFYQRSCILHMYNSMLWWPRW